MAADKLVDSTQLDSDLTSVANAIRAKSGGSSQLAFPSGFVSEIQAIPSGGGTLPDTYQEVEYIENTNTAYINSGVYFSKNRVDIEISASFNSHSAVGILAGYADVGGTWFGVLTSGKVGVGNTAYLPTPVSSAKNDYVAVFEESGITLSCGSESCSRTGTMNRDIPFQLFAGRNGNASNPQPTYFSYAKIYSAKIYVVGGLVRDFVPCYNKQTLEIGMYDLVSGTFYGNANSTGNFTKGQDVLSAQQALNVLLGVSE